MKIGLCTTVDLAAKAKQWGFDYIEEHVQNFLKPGLADSEFAAHALKPGQLPLPVSAAYCFLPGTLKSTGPDVDFAAIERYAATAFRRAEAIGIRKIGFGSGGSRQIPDGFPRDKARAQFIECLCRIAPLAARHHLIVAVESLNARECNFINSLADIADVVGAANHPNIRLLADIYHMLVDNEPADEIVTHGRWIGHAHIAEKEGRLAPGTSGEDFRPYLCALAKIGYNDTISYECGWKNIETDAPKSVPYLRDQLGA